MSNIKQAVIILEGSNSKMFPFDNRSLSALPIGNVAHIELIVCNLKDLGFETIHIVGTSFSKEKNLLRNYDDIEYILSGHDIGSVLASLVKQNDTLVYKSSSYVDTRDLEAFVKDSDGKDNRALLQENSANSFNYKDYICAQASEYVDNFYAHPRSSYVNSRATGVYILRKEQSSYLSNSSYKFENVNVGVISEEGFFIEQIFNDMIEDGHKVAASYCKNEFVELRFPWDVVQANYLETTKIDKEIVVGDNTVIDASVIFAGSAKIGSNTTITNGALIGDGVIIGDNVTITNYAKISNNTVIGNKCKIGYTAEVTGVILDNTAIVHNSHICGLIGSNVDVGAGSNSANLRFDDLNQSIAIAGRKYANKYTNYIYIGDSTRLGVGALISPGVRIGSNAAIGSGVLVSRDVNKESLLLLKQEQVTKEWGSKKHGW